MASAFLRIALVSGDGSLLKTGNLGHGSVGREVAAQNRWVHSRGADYSEPHDFLAGGKAGRFRQIFRECLPVTVARRRAGDRLRAVFLALHAPTLQRSFIAYCRWV